MNMRSLPRVRFSLRTSRKFSAFFAVKVFLLADQEESKDFNRKGRRERPPRAQSLESTQIRKRPSHHYRVCKYASRSSICSCVSTCPNPSILFLPRRIISATRSSFAGIPLEDRY